MANAKAMEVQKKDLHFALDKAWEKLEVIKLRSKEFEGELWLQKAMKITQNKQWVKNISTGNEVFTTNNN